MDALDLSSLRAGALVLVDSAPVIYVLEDHPRYASRFMPLFEMHANGVIRFAITTITIAEVLTGPVASGDESLVRRYRNTFESWQIVPLDAAIAESAARIRASSRMKLADAVQTASALAVDADALVTHDRDFSAVRSLRVIGG